MLIGISGKKRVGKDTVGHWLEIKHEFTRISFAALLKEYARAFGWDGKKDIKGRKLLQDLGMVVRNYNENFWVDAACAEMGRLKEEYNQENFVITDVRFMNEVEMIKDLGGYIIRVTSPTEIKTDIHVSETELDNYNFDKVINSVKGDLNSLFKQVDETVESFKGQLQRN